MSLLPAFDDFDATASWVTSTAGRAQPKFALSDNEFHHFDIANAAPSGHTIGDNDLEALFGIKFPSPQRPDPPVFDTGLPTSLLAPPSSALQSALASVIGGDASSSSAHAAASTLPTTTATGSDKGPNALQLDMLDTITPAHSPLAVSSGYTSPSFQFSPTPGLTMCPTTADSTPAPRSNSRCSSRSSFSLQTEDVKPCISTVSSEAKPVVADVVIGADGKPKKQHLCPYEDCPRHIRTFRSNADLQRHIRSHRGERPYACPAPGCGKAYGQQNKMVNHVKQQHPALLSVVEVGRSRRRAPASAPASAANSRAPSMSRAPSAASTPGATPVRVPIRPPISAPASVGPSRPSAVPTGARPAPYNLPTSMSSSHLLAQSARRDNELGAAAMNMLRHDVFGTSSQSMSQTMW